MNKLMQGVGSTCGVMMSWAVISFSLMFIHFTSLASMVTLCLPCFTGGTLGSHVMVHAPGILPILSKEIFYVVDGHMVLQWGIRNGMVLHRVCG